MSSKMSLLAPSVTGRPVSRPPPSALSVIVLRATVKLHPALIILALLVGGSVGGLLGVILAVPLLAVAKVLVGHFWRTRVLGEPWEQAVEAIVHEPDPSATAEMLAVRLRRRQGEDGPAEPRDDEATGPGE